MFACAVHLVSRSPHSTHSLMSPILSASLFFFLQLLPYPTSSSTDDLANSELLNVIREGNIDLVINLPNAKSTRNEFNYLVRRTAVDFAVPLLTNSRLVTMFADAMEKHTKEPMVGLVPSSLFEYYKKEKASDAWTSPSEFH